MFNIFIYFQEYWIFGKKWRFLPVYKGYLHVDFKGYGIMVLVTPYTSLCIDPTTRVSKTASDSLKKTATKTKKRS